MRESGLLAYFQRPTHYYTTFGLAMYDERVHIKVVKIAPPSRLAAWVLNERAKVEEYALRVPYERIHRLHDLIIDQTEAYFNRKKRSLYTQVTRELEQFIHETRCNPVVIGVGS